MDSSMVKHSTTVEVEVELIPEGPKALHAQGHPIPGNVAPEVHVQCR
jgi:hypothetical protein